MYEDEEDQSIYYPPPYSFVYKSNASGAAVPPGPLVPGIILPPPPDFFAPLDGPKRQDEKRPLTTVKDKYAKRVLSNALSAETTSSTTAASSTRASQSPSLYVPRKSSSSVGARIKAVSFETTTRRPKSSSSPRPSTTPSRYSPKTALRKPIVSASRNNASAFVVPESLIIAVTTPVPLNKHTTTFKTLVSNQVPESSKEWTVNSKSVPLLAAFYATTTTTTPPPETSTKGNEVDLVSAKYPPKTSYFFYGEPPSSTEPSTTSSTTGRPFFNNNDNKLDEQRQPLYNHVDHEYQLEPSPPLYFATATPAPVYPQQQTHAKSKPKPIYQFSFESADYQAKHEQLDKKKRSKKKKPQQSELASYDYQDEDVVQQSVSEPHFEYHARANQLPFRDKDNEVVYSTATPLPVDSLASSTLEPHRAYFTKQDEQLLDDVTKEYFTMFGKKLTGGARVAHPSTTPIYGKAVTDKPLLTRGPFSVGPAPSLLSRYKSPKVKVRYGGQTAGRRPFSLEGDTLVNYRQPLPLIEPESEFLAAVVGHEQTRSAKLVQGQDYGVRPVHEPDDNLQVIIDQHL